MPEGGELLEQRPRGGDVAGRGVLGHVQRDGDLVGDVPVGLGRHRPRSAGAGDCGQGCVAAAVGAVDLAVQAGELVQQSRCRDRVGDLGRVDHPEGQGPHPGRVRARGEPALEIRTGRSRTLRPPRGQPLSARIRLTDRLHGRPLEVGLQPLHQTRLDLGEQARQQHLDRGRASARRGGSRGGGHGHRIEHASDSGHTRHATNRRKVFSRKRTRAPASQQPPCRIVRRDAAIGRGDG